MWILGNMKVLSLCSRVLTSLSHQDGYCGCGENQRYYYGRYSVYKPSVVAPKFRLRRVQKRAKKRQKYGSQKLYGVGVLAKIFF